MNNFVHCVGCGHQLHVTAPTCPKCGAPQRVAATSPQAAAPSATAMPLDQVQVSETWRKRFAFIEKAGGPKLKNAKTLSKEDQKLIFPLVNRNYWALIFGAFYYLYLGMWKKAISYTVVTLGASVLLGILFDAVGWSGLSKGLVFGAAGFFMLFANIDYYRKMVLNDNGWW